MFEEGNIIYFTPFYFINGQSAPKPKYCIVLKAHAENAIIASLPTRKDTIPSYSDRTTGCIELPDINLNTFIFEINTIVTECGKRFEFDTFVYGHQLEVYSKDLFKDLYRIEGTDFEIFGKLKPELYQRLLKCLRDSKSVKKKFIRYL